MNTPLWQPSPEAIARTRLTEFSRQVGFASDRFSELHRWSIEHPEDFWQAAWKYFEIEAAKQYSRHPISLANIELIDYLSDLSEAYAAEHVRYDDWHGRH